MTTTKLEAIDIRKSYGSHEVIKGMSLTVDALGDEGSRLSPGLKRRLSYLPDAHGLWYARPEMVEVLSRVHGEVKAIDTVRDLSPFFAGLLPKSLVESASRTPR
jgi:ABC-type histidine transport system ATPase subunit